MDKSYLSDLYPRVKKVLRIPVLKFMYRRTLHRLRKAYGKRQLNVGFFISEIAKWKGQCLYDYLLTTQEFKPIILVYPSGHELNKEFENLKSILDEKEAYFKGKGMNVMQIWDYDANQSFSLASIPIDIVFYQQPWDIPPAPICRKVAQYALTYYFPYYMPNNFLPDLEVKRDLHCCIYRRIVFNQQQMKLFRLHMNSIYYAGKMIPLGHPTADYFYLHRNHTATKNYVIYAPHFSFKSERESGVRPYYSSTFLERGREMLQYAKSHPEINWVFKPHPLLRNDLIDLEEWSKQEVDEYYSEWEKIGLACYDSSYLDLFIEAKAMITDCSSFLTEFSCTGKPLIRLIPKKGETLISPDPMLEKIYDMFYKVYEGEDMKPILDSIVLNDEDSRKEKRLKLLEEANLTGTYASKNITEYIRKDLRGY